MTINTTTTQISYTGNGTATEFAFPFVVPELNYLIVEIIVIATGVPTVLTQDQYSVTGIGDPTGGVVTYPLVGSPLSSSYYISIRREVEFDQPFDFINQSNLYAETIEDAYDYLEMQIQQINTNSSRALTLVPGDVDGSGRYDAKGNRIINLGDPVDIHDAVNKDYVDTIMVAAGNVPSPLLSQVGFVLTATGAATYDWQDFSTAGFLLAANNLSDLANAATARTNLGLGDLAVLDTVGTAQIDANAVTATQLAAASVTIAKINASGVAGSSTFLRGDGAWASPGRGPTAWVSFQISGGVVTVKNSFNVTSVTRSAAGKYTVAFTSAFADAFYIVQGMTDGVASPGYGTGFIGFDYANPPTTTDCHIINCVVSGYYGAIVGDASYITLAFIPSN